MGVVKTFGRARVHVPQSADILFNVLGIHFGYALSQIRLLQAFPTLQDLPFKERFSSQRLISETIICYDLGSCKRGIAPKLDLYMF